jgi:hypothetical protein
MHRIDETLGMKPPRYDLVKARHGKTGRRPARENFSREDRRPAVARLGGLPPDAEQEQDQDEGERRPQKPEQDVDHRVSPHARPCWRCGVFE